MFDERLEKQEIIVIQRSILSKLSVGVMYQAKEHDIYVDNLLNSIIKNNIFWFWQLLFVPLDNDFLELSYRIVLDREPDFEGFSHFHAALSANTISRLGVLVTMMNANEKRDSLVTGGWKWVASLNNINQVLRKTPLLSQIMFLIWGFSTDYRREQRNECLMKELLENARELNQFKIDLDEYLNNPLRRKVLR